MTLPGLGRPPADRDVELAADLFAAGSAVEWLTRPSLLRRIADGLAAAIPATTDRILATGVGAAALGAAVALRTGLPFAVDGLGVVRAGEEVAVVAVEPVEVPGAHHVFVVGHIVRRDGDRLVPAGLEGHA